MAEKARQRRYEIAEAAIGLFIDRGYEQVTAEDIAAEVGVGVRTFFRYFATKEDAAFPDHESRVERFIEALQRRRGANDPVRTVVEVTAESVREYFRDPELYRPRYQLVRTEPALRNHERIANRAYENAIANHLTTELGDSPGHRVMARAMAGAIIAGVDQVLDDWANETGLDPETHLADFQNLMNGFPRKSGDQQLPATPEAIVLADDPALRLELIRVVQAHRQRNAAPPLQKE